MIIPKISIITVCYNSEETIEKTILSVINQTYQNLEYIIIDGASKDSTVDIINKYRYKIAHFVSEPDKGIYDAMNKGAKMATGEWLLFRNSGDFFFSHTSIEDLFKMYKEDNKEDFLLADSRLFRKWGYKDVKPSILNKSFYDAMPVLHPSTFVRRSTQLKFPFHLNYKNSSDYCFFVEALKSGATYRYFDLLLALVENDTGITASHFDRTLKENIDFLNKMGAPKERIKQLERILCKNKISKFIPFIDWYRKKKLLNDGWIEANLSDILKNV